MRRWEFIGLISGAAAWPLAVRAQQTGIPVVGVLSPQSAGPTTASRVAGFLEGLAEAQFELGKVYDRGIGGSRDPFEAVRWYRLAAQQGLGRAQYNLGAMHGNGEGVPVDYVKAYVWFSISEATLSPPEREAARNAKGQAAQMMMPDDLARALQMAQRCLSSAYQNCD